ncbi:MAG TPA: branched-chain amino acid transaminase [Actinomycetota bacterium]|nr:branched-chain amino acid transaminase [Actinomycetota bacterium]
MPIQPVDKIWMDGKLVDWEDATIHVLTHALHYGSGVFEGVRAYETRRGAAVFRLTDHIRRLFRSAHVYHLEIPFSVEELVQGVKDTVRENGLSSGYIRPLAYRGYGEMGLNPLRAPVNVSISCWPWGTYLGEDSLETGVRAKISSWKRTDHNVLPPGAKATGQYINSGLAKVEALDAGYDEGIMLNMGGHVTDGPGENIFIVRDGILYTPPFSAGCLDGITRDSIITIANDQGYTVMEQNLSRFDLYTADEAFYTGTAAEVAPIREIDDRAMAAGGRGPITKELQEIFFAATKGEIEKYQGWLEYVDS